MNLQPMRKNEILQLAQKIDPNDPNLSLLSKEELIEFVKANANDGDAVAVANTDENTITETEEEVLTVDMNKDHPEWTQYVLDQLHLTELVNGRPSVDGLRRIFRKLEGHIVSSQGHVVQAPNDNQNQGRAVVQYTITYLPYDFPDSPVVITDAADCYWGNTVKPFCNHATATATTMAEGRCLRKALGIRVLTNEEMQNPEGTDAKLIDEQLQDSNPAPENVKVAIMRMAEKQKINLPSLLKYLDEVKTADISNISAMEGRLLMNKLNGYQQNKEPIPNEILTGQTGGVLY